MSIDNFVKKQRKKERYDEIRYVVQIYFDIKNYDINNNVDITININDKLIINVNIELNICFDNDLNTNSLQKNLYQN